MLGTERLTLANREWTCRGMFETSTSATHAAEQGWDSGLLGHVDQTPGVRRGGRSAQCQAKSRWPAAETTQVHFSRPWGLGIPDGGVGGLAPPVAVLSVRWHLLLVSQGGPSVCVLTPSCKNTGWARAALVAPLSLGTSSKALCAHAIMF